VETKSKIWPLSTTKVELLQHELTKLESDLSHETFKSNLRDIVQIFEYHRGDKALSIHIVGKNTRKDQTAIGIMKGFIPAIARSIYGDDHQKNILILKEDDQLNEDKMVEMIVKQLQSFPSSLIAIENFGEKLNPLSFGYLTSALNDNHPFIEWNHNRVDTRESIFILASTFQPEEFNNYSSGSSGGDDEVDETEAKVKKALQNRKWPDRVCQRLRHLILLN
jgi:hypothetical protein